MMSAGHHGLDNLIAIVDVNNQQADGPSTEMLGFEPLVPKLEAFGWFTQRIDGNDIDAVRAAFDAATAELSTRPRIIVCDTRMGCGVPFLEAREKNHFIRVEEHEGSSRSPPSTPKGPRDGRATTEKPRLKTSAMIASIAAEGQATKPAPSATRWSSSRRPGPRSSA